MMSRYKKQIMAIASVVAVIATLLGNIDKILLTVNRWISNEASNINNLPAKIVELSMSTQQTEWEDLSDQISVITDDIRRLKEWVVNPDQDAIFTFNSKRYANEEPRLSMAWYPNADFLTHARYLLDWNFNKAASSNRSVFREPLFINLGIRNNTDRELAINKVTMRLNALAFDWTSAGDITPLDTSQHRSAASLIRFQWPVSTEEFIAITPDQLNYGYNSSPALKREDTAQFDSPLIVMPGSIQRIKIEIEIPKLSFFGRQNALTQFILMTSEGEITSENVYLTMTELAF